MISGVQDQVLSHDSKTDEAEISTGIRVRSADIDAGKTRTEVSIAQHWLRTRRDACKTWRSMFERGCEGVLRCTYTAPDILAGLIDEGFGLSGVIVSKLDWLEAGERNTVQEVCSNAPKKRVSLVVV